MLIMMKNVFICLLSFHLFIIIIIIIIILHLFFLYYLFTDIHLFCFFVCVFRYLSRI